MRERTLTPTDREVFEFIKGYKLRHNGNSPSHRDIVEGTNISSTGHLSFVLEKLQDFGYITLGEGHRSIILKEVSWQR